MDKKEQFKILAKDVSKCHVCENMSVSPYCNCGEILLNDDHGLETDRPYVNLWNLWQGNLDADIMVIGQDFGKIEDVQYLQKEWRNGTYTNFTDRKLRELFKDSFHINIDSENASLFFTNMVNCYRKNSTTGEMHNGWLPTCANKFMRRLVDIIEPKIIIVLGKNVFEAMCCIDDARVECVNPTENNTKNTFANILEYNYQLVLSDNKKIPIFPVYHPGANSQRNRSYNEQKHDWQKIAECYSMVK